MLSVAELQTDADGLRPKMAAFLEAVIETGSITDAADKVKMSRQSAYDWLDAEKRQGIDVDNPPQGSFAYALLRAKKLAGERAAGRIHWHSNNSPGMPGVIASIAAAKRYDPGWNDQLNVKHSGTVWHASVDLGTLGDTDRAQLLALAAERAHARVQGDTQLRLTCAAQGSADGERSADEEP